MHVIEFTLNPNDTDARPDLGNSSAPTSTPAPPPTPAPSSLSTGAKAGIGVGVGLGALLILGLTLWYVRRRSGSGRSTTRGNGQVAVEMPPSGKVASHEMQAPESGSLAWEMDTRESQKGGLHELQ